MRIKSVLAIAAVAALAAGAAVLASSQDAKGPGTMGHGGVFGPPGTGEPGRHGGFGTLGLPLRELGLTQEQQDKVHAILDEARPALEPLRTRLRDSEMAFREAHPITEFDEAAIREHVAAQAKIQADLEVAIAKVRSEVVALLTAEQLTTIKDLRAKAHEGTSRGEHGHHMADAPATQ